MTRGSRAAVPRDRTAAQAAVAGGAGGPRHDGARDAQRHAHAQGEVIRCARCREAAVSTKGQHEPEPLPLPSPPAAASRARRFVDSGGGRGGACSIRRSPGTASAGELSRGEGGEIRRGCERGQGRDARQQLRQLRLVPGRQRLCPGAVSAVSRQGGEGLRVVQLLGATDVDRGGAPLRLWPAGTPAAAGAADVGSGSARST
jgi:hypothetical protein